MKLDDPDIGKGSATTPTALPRDEDTELLARAAHGDAAAFDALLARHGAALLRFARRVCDSPTEGDDALQDALLAAWRAAPGFRGEGPVRGWLYRTVINACHHRQRLRVGQPRRLESIDAAASLPAPGVDAVAQIERQEQSRALSLAFAALDAEDRKILVLRDVECLPGEEVAAILGLSLAAMKSRLHRARLELKRRCDSLAGEEPETKEGSR